MSAETAASLARAARAQRGYALNEKGKADRLRAKFPELALIYERGAALHRATAARLAARAADRREGGH